MLVVPAGQALAALVRDVVAGNAPGITSLDQVFSDDVHLLPLGNYLMALLHYGVSYQRSPVGVTVSVDPVFGSTLVVPDATASYLQNLAATYVSRTFNEAVNSQRGSAECVAALTDVCTLTPDTNQWVCNTALPEAFSDDAFAVQASCP